MLAGFSMGAAPWTDETANAQGSRVCPELTARTLPALLTPSDKLMYWVMKMPKIKIPVTAIKMTGSTKAVSTSAEPSL
jgi:hypothetical protein